MIEVENHSPFPHLAFEKSGYLGKSFDVLAIKGTFRLNADGARATPVEDQRPLVMADTYWGEPETSSLKVETDLVITKKRSDIHVVGHARAEHGKPRPQWEAGIRIGGLEKCLRVTGPRYWEYGLVQWKLSAPEAVSEVPLRYELALGGSYTERVSHGEPDVRAFRRNPIGLGYHDWRQLDRGRRHAAPQFESLSGPRIGMDTHGAMPEGLGPLSRWWEPRVDHAGTYDAEWKTTRWPYLPDDFDFAFYNSAHPDLQYEGYLEGDEPLVLVGLLPEANVITTALGAYTPICVVEDDDCLLHRLLPRLDTVTIDTDARLIYHTWRLTLPRDFGARHIVLGAIVPPPEQPTGSRLVTLRTKKEAGHG
jgi:hypothetical protein